MTQHSIDRGEVPVERRRHRTCFAWGTIPVGVEQNWIGTPSQVQQVGGRDTVIGPIAVVGIVERGEHVRRKAPNGHELAVLADRVEVSFLKSAARELR